MQLLLRQSRWFVFGTTDFVLTLCDIELPVKKILLLAKFEANFYFLFLSFKGSYKGFY